MAALTWVCPVGGCDARQDHPGTCPDDLVQLVRERTEPAARSAEPDPVAAAPTGLALDCHWGQLIDIPDGELMIGRSSEAFRDSGIEDFLQVSRVHARLFWQDGQLHVVDLTSANGTFVDGRRLTADMPVRVCAGQQIRLGLDVLCKIVQLNEFGEPM